VTGTHPAIGSACRRLARLFGLLQASAISLGSPGRSTCESHAKLAAAKKFFAEKLDQIFEENPTTWTDRMAAITKYLQSQARVVVVETASDADAYTIFETLNDRGPI
jgi:hypothetical protein